MAKLGNTDTEQIMVLANAFKDYAVDIQQTRVFLINASTLLLQQMQNDNLSRLSVAQLNNQLGELTSVFPMIENIVNGLLEEVSRVNNIVRDI
ncbi:MAG: hypothetical protein IJI41_03155 [Anaerolineaceae bacterium]|nr:hypothetical protein [Anaerolineaceae bacterium]